MILLYCSHNLSNGSTLSQAQAVVPYGKSHTMQSTLPSGILFIPSRQSSLYILFSSIMLCYFANLSVKPFHSCLPLIPFLPHEPCVSRCAAAVLAEVAIHSTFQSRRTYPDTNGGVERKRARRALPSRKVSLRNIATFLPSGMMLRAFSTNCCAYL